jgi:hypothetical protein
MKKQALAEQAKYFVSLLKFNIFIELLRAPIGLDNEDLDGYFSCS